MSGLWVPVGQRWLVPLLCLRFCNGIDLGSAGDKCSMGFLPAWKALTIEQEKLRHGTTSNP